MMMNQRTRKLQMMKTSSRLSMTRYLSHVIFRWAAKIKFSMTKLTLMTFSKPLSPSFFLIFTEIFCQCF